MLAAIAAILMAIPAAAAALPEAAIISTGPLEQIIISNELNCQVAHVADQDFEFYPPTVRTGACATQIHVDGTTYGPSDLPAGNTPVPFTPVSQSPATGSGTATDPFEIVTVVDVGTTGLRLTETDAYVSGQETYRTDIVIQNSSDVAQELILYRAGDCYLQQSDFGFGAADPTTGAVSCVGTDDEGKSPGSRIIQWYPLTPGSNYVEDIFGQVWTLVDLGRPFPNTIANEFMDNAAGLSWSLTIPAGGSTTVTQLMVVSPLGLQPLATSKSADQPTSTVAGRNGYTIQISNPNTFEVTLDSVTDMLPAGFSYVAGSSGGATSNDPAISGQQLTWAGPLVVAPESILLLDFDVTVGQVPGTYFNEAAAAGDGLTVIPTGPTAPVVVEPAAALAITNTATTSYTRTWEWSIAKTADTATLTLTPDEQATIGYRVEVDATPVDADWAVDGTITITNPTSLDALIESVDDEVSDVGMVPVVCPGGLPQPLLSGDTLVCAYSGSLPDGAGRVSRATVTTGPGPVTGSTAEAELEFDAPTTEIDESVTVTDSLVGPLGPAEATSAPTHFEYDAVVGPFACGVTNVDNSATFVTGDTATSDTAIWRLAVTVECDTGCTHGSGYWKTHSEHGPASYDPAWGLLLDGADTEFVGSGNSWYEVFQSAPKGGNAWYQLAHSYMAARLNELGGAAVPSEVAAALADAELLLTRYASDQAIPKKSSDRDLALQLAGALSDYNTGETGPGSC